MTIGIHSTHRALFHTAILVGPLLFVVSLCTAQTANVRLDLSDAELQRSGSVDWPIYRGDAKANQYSALAQINATNVHTLRPAWEYHTGDAVSRSTMYSNPIVINGVLFATTPSLQVVALDAANGTLIWSFDPAEHNGGDVVRLRNRGVAHWKGDEGERIFHFVRDRVYAVDAVSGELIRSFGMGGHIDLREDLGIEPADVDVQVTTPGAIYKNLLVLGSRVNESYGSSPGHIRAYDTITGQLQWIFHTIPQAGEFGHDTWHWPEGETFGGANAWGGLTVDVARGWVFAATGSATDDFYGGFRKGDNLFSDSVLALDATTGERKWHYQTVRHDVWDYDNPPAPILVTLRTGETSRDAVVQLTKMGLTFVLDRDTGESIFPVMDMPVPRSDVPGEETSPTQPYPLNPPPLVRQSITEADLTNITPEAHEYALQQFRKYRSGSIYTPPSLQGTITMPGNLGGAQWHGGSFDPQLNVLYVNVHEVPTINQLRPIYGDGRVGGEQAESTPTELGREIYETSCMSCHGSDRKGRPPLFPALIDTTLSGQEFRTVVTEGRNIMPAYPRLRPAQLDALEAYLSSSPDAVPSTGGPAQRYSIDGYIKFTDQSGLPGISPPWGTLNAIDLVNGEILWKVPLGEYPELVAKGIRNTGTLNFGGAVATAGGLIFIAATADEKIRAFEKHSGRVLWEYQLPAGGYATPSVYMVDGKQYVVIATGGSGKNGTKAGDSIIAFALPADEEEQIADGRDAAASDSGWIDLFDGKSLDGWVHMNGAHRYAVEDGAIVGRTVESSARMNSFLCSLQQFDDFELELETYIDPITNSGIQFRSTVRAMPATGAAAQSTAGRAGRVNGPQLEIRRFYEGQPTTGVLYGEALGSGWMSSRQKIDEGHHLYVDEGWNKLRIVARGPRIQTWVNGHLIEDLVDDDVYRTHKKGFIGLQVHGINERDTAQPANDELGITTSQPLIAKWRSIRIRPLSSSN